MEYLANPIVQVPIAGFIGGPLGMKYNRIIKDTFPLQTHTVIAAGVVGTGVSAASFIAIKALVPNLITADLKGVAILALATYGAYNSIPPVAFNLWQATYNVLHGFGW